MPTKSAPTARAAGLREIKLALEPNMEFERIVEVLRETLTVRLPKGCAPCLSGLDRLVIDSVVFESINERSRAPQIDISRM